MRGSVVVTRLRRGGWISVALLAAAFLVASSGTYQALNNPPYLDDEAAHVGYVLELAEGRLPDIRTRVPSGTDSALAARITDGGRWYAPHVYVANNPPYPYLLAVPVVKVADGLGAPMVTLVFMRMTGVFGAVVAVVATFLLGRELAGGSSLVGMVASGVLAGVLSVTMISSLAQLDGLALAATTTTTWLACRFVRTCDRRHALHLGLGIAVCAAVRPMAMAVALVAGLLVLLVTLPRIRGDLLTIVLRLSVPAALTGSWFYVLNIRRYGDPTASGALFGMFSMHRRSDLPRALLGRRTFVDPFGFLLTEIDSEEPYFLYTGHFYRAALLGVVLVVVSVLVVLGAMALGMSGRRVDDHRRDTVPAQWLVAFVLSTLPVVLLAQHWSAGGGAHPRYLLGILPLVAVSAAFVSLMLGRLPALVLTVAAVVAHLARLAAAGRVRLGHHFAWGQWGSVVSGPLPQVALVLAFCAGTTLVWAAVSAARRKGPAKLDGSRPQAVP